jgi:hypothetical protein
MISKIQLKKSWSCSDRTEEIWSCDVHRCYVNAAVNNKVTWIMDLPVVSKHCYSYRASTFPKALFQRTKFAFITASRRDVGTEKGDRNDKQVRHTHSHGPWLACKAKHVSTFLVTDFSLCTNGLAFHLSPAVRYDAQFEATSPLTSNSNFMKFSYYAIQRGSYDLMWSFVLVCSICILTVSVHPSFHL